MWKKIASFPWRHFQTLMKAYRVHVQTFSFWYLIFSFPLTILFLTTLLPPRELKSKAENYHISLHILLLFLDYLLIKQKLYAHLCSFASVLPFSPVNLLLVKSNILIEKFYKTDNVLWKKQRNEKLLSHFYIHATGGIRQWKVYWLCLKVI